MSGFIQETLEKLLMVQAMDVAPQMEKRAAVLLKDRYETQRKRRNVSLFANTSVNIMYYGAGFFALIWCSVHILMGTMSFGTLTAITQLVSQLQNPLVNLSGVIPQYIAMTAAAERLMELEDLEQETEASGEDPQELYCRMDCLGGEHLTFLYDREPILEDASFRLEKGDFAVITGPSGVGKSTLLKLLLGIYRPQKGGLYLESEGQRSELSRSQRKIFAYVPQGNLLLSGTLRDNLTLTRPDATEEEIRQALHASAMEDYLPQLPQGLDTVLGENAHGLSEGQAQRLAIARAVLSEAPILLLDEATSALDGDTEETVLRRLHELPGRTCIAVTHRPAALDIADVNLEVRDRKLVISRINHTDSN